MNKQFNLLNLNSSWYHLIYSLVYFSPLVTRVRPQARSWLVKLLPTTQLSSLSGRLKLQEKLHILSQFHQTKFSWKQMICCWTFRRWIWILLERNRHYRLNYHPFNPVNQLYCGDIPWTWAVHKLNRLLSFDELCETRKLRFLSNYC